jgi:hypothetical protein
MNVTPLPSGLPLTRLGNAHLRVDVSPVTGGRITSIFHKPLEREFLWRNKRLPLRPSAPGSAYDPNFYGGIDEVIPGDLPETITGLECPDHGELWTLPLNAQIDGKSLVLEGRLPTWGLRYHKRISLRPDAPWIDLEYRIENVSGERRVFLWKLHPALAISPGDQIVCPARSAVAADPQWSRWKTTAPFAWPVIDDSRADIVPPADGTTDFLFLYDLPVGEITLRRPSVGCQFTISYDRKIFPYICYFASYGGFDGHYTAILEPCTAMPLSVNGAARLGQCSMLDVGERLDTRISIYAGPLVD